MDMLSILAIATQCATAAPAPIVAAMAMAETGGAAYSIQIGDERIIHPDFDSAVQAAALGLLNGDNVKVGIIAVSTQEFDKRSISYSEGFSACRNMEIASEGLRESWEQFGGQDEHWRLAVIEMATGNPDVEGEFSQSFDLALIEVQKIIQNNPHSLQSPTQKVNGSTQSVMPHPAKSSHPPESMNMDKAWDIYDRASSIPLLIFSK